MLVFKYYLTFSLHLKTFFVEFQKLNYEINKILKIFFSLCLTHNFFKKQKDNFFCS